MKEIVRIYPGTNTASKARDNAKYPDKDVTSQTITDDDMTNNVYNVAPITPQVSSPGSHYPVVSLLTNCIKVYVN